MYSGIKIFPGHPTTRTDGPKGLIGPGILPSLYVPPPPGQPKREADGPVPGGGRPYPDYSNDSGE